MGAEDVGDLQGGAPHGGGLRGRQRLQRADHLAQDLGGHVGVERRGLELLVAEQHLDHADVDLLLQQVGGKAVAQRVHRHALVDLRGLGGGMDGAVELARGQRVHRVRARGTASRRAASCPGHGPRATRRAAARAAPARAWRSGPCGPCPARRAASCAGCRCRRPSARSPRWRAARRRRPPTAPSGASGCGAAAIRRATSSRLSTTGSVRGTRTGCILAISSPRSSVTSKKNFRPVIVALSVIGEVPRSTRCSWKRRRSSTVAVSGERLEEGGELAHRADVAGLRLGLELAHAHVVDHALAQRRDACGSMSPWFCSCR